MKKLPILLAILLSLSVANASFAYDRLKDKIAIITGASKGIGLGVAKVFCSEGAKVILISRTEDDLKKATENLKKTNSNIDVFYIVADVSKYEDMQHMAQLVLKKYGRIDILVHNAAVLPKPKPFDQLEQRDWLHIIDNNLNGTFYAVKAVVEAMKAQKYGRIVFTSSISGPRVGLQNKSNYTASKAGVNGFMKSIAIELAKYNITVNAVEPGNIITEGLSVANSPQVIVERTKAIPMGRLGTAEEIAYAELFLASDEAQYITGQSMIVDGGQTLPESQHSEY